MINRQYLLLMLVSVLISSISQIVLKLATLKKYNSKIREYLNFQVISAYSIFFLATCLTIFSLRYIPLSVATLVEAMGYVFIIVFGKLFLDEKITTNKVIGTILILAGVFIASV